MDYQRSEASGQCKTEAGILSTGISISAMRCSSGYGIVWVVVAAVARQQSEQCGERQHRRLPQQQQCQQRKGFCSPRFPLLARSLSVRTAACALGRRNTVPFHRDYTVAVEPTRGSALGKTCRRRPGRRMKQTAFRTYAFGMRGFSIRASPERPL